MQEVYTDSLVPRMLVCMESPGVEQWKVQAIAKLESIGILMPGAHQPGKLVDMGLLAAVLCNLLKFLGKIN